MINENSIDFYNSRLTFDYTKTKDLTPSQKDKIRTYGSQAEALLKNRDLALFIHHFKFDLADQLANLNGHTPDDNSRRVAIANELRGIDQFVATLQRAVYMKNRAVNQAQEGPRVDPADILHREYE